LGIERLAALLYVSPTQVNFQVPAGTAPGEATLTLAGPTGQAALTARVEPVAPGIFEAGTPGFYDFEVPAGYVMRIEPDGAQTITTVLSCPDPANCYRPQIEIDPQRPTYLVLFATGIRNRTQLANVHCTSGTAAIPVEYAGPAGFSGLLDQITLRLDQELKGFGGYLTVTVDGLPANSVYASFR
jgi:uncharacterized protein (TIGR03437 family)